MFNFGAAFAQVVRLALVQFRFGHVGFHFGFRYVPQSQPLQNNIFSQVTQNYKKINSLST